MSLVHEQPSFLRLLSPLEILTCLYFGRLTLAEYHEQEEIFKLRLGHLKKVGRKKEKKIQSSNLSKMTTYSDRKTLVSSEGAKSLIETLKIKLKLHIDGRALRFKMAARLSNSLIAFMGFKFMNHQPENDLNWCVYAGGSRDPSRAGAVGAGEEPPYQRAEEDKQRGQLSVSLFFRNVTQWFGVYTVDTKH